MWLISALASRDSVTAEVITVKLFLFKYWAAWLSGTAYALQIPSLWSSLLRKVTSGNLITILKLGRHHRRVPDWKFVLLRIFQVKLSILMIGGKVITVAYFGQNRSHRTQLSIRPRELLQEKQWWRRSWWDQRLWWYLSNVCRCSTYYLQLFPVPSRWSDVFIILVASRRSGRIEGLVFWEKRTCLCNRTSARVECDVTRKK